MLSKSHEKCLATRFFRPRELGCNRRSQTIRACRFGFDKEQQLFLSRRSSQIQAQTRKRIAKSKPLFRDRHVGNQVKRGQRTVSPRNNQPRIRAERSLRHEHDDDRYDCRRREEKASAKQKEGRRRSFQRFHRPNPAFWQDRTHLRCRIRCGLARPKELNLLWI